MRVRTSPRPEAKADLASLLLVAAGQGDVFEQLGGDRGKAAELAVDCGANEQVLAVGGGIGQRGIADAARAVLHGQFAEDERHEQLLAEAGEKLLGRIGEQVGVVLLGLGDGGGERAFEMLGVGIGEQQPLALRGRFAGDQGVGLAGPSRRQRLRRVEHMNIEEELIEGDERTLANPGKAFRDGAGAVGGGVVDDENLKGDALLHHQRTQAALEVGLFIAGRNDDGNLRNGIRKSRGVHN